MKNTIIIEKKLFWCF